MNKLRRYGVKRPTRRAAPALAGKRTGTVGIIARTEQRPGRLLDALCRAREAIRAPGVVWAVMFDLALNPVGRQTLCA